MLVFEKFADIQGSHTAFRVEQGVRDDSVLGIFQHHVFQIQSDFGKSFEKGEPHIVDVEVAGEESVGLVIDDFRQFRR